MLTRCIIYLLHLFKYMMKKACTISTKYKCYAYFKMAYTHDAEHDVTKILHNFEEGSMSKRIVFSLKDW